MGGFGPTLPLLMIILEAEAHGNRNKWESAAALCRACPAAAAVGCSCAGVLHHSDETRPEQHGNKLGKDTRNIVRFRNNIEQTYIFLWNSYTYNNNIEL